MEFPNELMRYILAIKYFTWRLNMECACGYYVDECIERERVITCIECEVSFCARQEGYNNWIWYCDICYYMFCGKHIFNEKSGSRICMDCVNITYKLDEEKEIAGIGVVIPRNYQRRNRLN